MSILIYNGVPITPWRTLSVDIEPVYTDDRADVLYHRFTIEGTACVNPTQTVGAFLNGATVGNLDTNINQIRRALLEPRQSLAFTLSEEDNSFILQSPPFDGTGTLLKTDCDNGPHPQYCRILQVWGTHSALIAYKITTTVSNCSKMILANRWTLSHSVDANGFTTRRQQGRAILRSDIAWYDNPTPWILDQFRQLFFLPPPKTFRRIGVDVTQSSDGLSYDYSVTDREVLYGTGGNGGVTRVDGHVTSGYTWPQKNTWEAAGAAVSTLWDAGMAMLNPFGVLGRIQNVVSRLPTSNATAVVRVHGQRTASLTTLANVAIAVAIDRLTPQAILGFKTPVINSAYLTQSLDSDGAPFVQLTVTCLTSLFNAVDQGAFGVTSLPSGQDMSSAFNIPGGTNLSRDAPVTQALPSSSGTRGTYLGSLFAQALISGCDPPALPVIDATVPDATSLF